LRKQGTATQLIVDGKPFLALAGELLNNSATSVEHMKPIWPKLAASKYNTVLAGVSWDQIEPQEGKFDFSVLDGVVRDARSHNLRLVLLWFGSWKNSLSSYAPLWLKKDFERFPRAQAAGGRSIELLSPFSDANRDADARAFAALMRHVKAVDGQQHTVIMIQVENEVGMHGDSRDRSPAAAKAFAEPVPKELMDYLRTHKDTLIPDVRQVWEAAGFKTSGTWEEVFGQSRVTDGFFMAWYISRYIGRVAQAGKAEYPIPMNVNAALPRTASIAEVAARKPDPAAPQRSFAIGGPMADVIDVWRAGAPAIDILSPDIYGDGQFVAWCAKYSQSGNPLFIPETRGNMEAKAMYVFGRHDAVGLSLMGVERPTATDPDMVRGFELIAQLAPLISKHQGNGTMTAVVLAPDDPPRKIQLGNSTLEVARMGGRRPAAPAAGQAPAAAPGRGPAPAAAPGPAPSYAGAIFIAVGPDEYYAAGTEVSVAFTPNTPGPEHAGIGTVEEGIFVNGRWIPSRQLAGDETGEGQNLSLRSHPADRIADSYVGIQRFTLYRYR
jgi:beta-galactosidase GanA